MRSSIPTLTVPQLLKTHHQEEGDGASEREDGTSGVWALQGSFFVVPGSPVCGVGGNVGGISVSGGEFVPDGLQ